MPQKSKTPPFKLSAMSWSRKKRPLAERFWEKVIKGAHESSCWSWDGAKTGFGYGVIGTGIAKRMDGAHRVSWQLHYGDIPAGSLICHTCDNPECCNPLHLFVGSYSDNMQDCKAKGRFSKPPISKRKGVLHPMCRFSENEILQLRKAYRALPLSKSGRNKKLGSVSDLANTFGIRKEYLQVIVNGTAWAHLHE